MGRAKAEVCLGRKFTGKASREVTAHANIHARRSLDDGRWLRTGRAQAAGRQALPPGALRAPRMPATGGLGPEGTLQMRN
mmetsp:Transcript_731/g.1188  ORF Transcript_731/g.1188 Transcript_731/m.1188 type:complete len:80 (+) Transcript_731:122-361(+)